MNNYGVLFDANVLVNACLRDTLLRLAEEPRFYVPRWSDDIIDELTRTLELKLHRTPAQTSHLVRQLQDHFREAWVTRYKRLIPVMTNHSKDRHVLAAAVAGRVQTIVTLNLKHFPTAALAEWDIEAQAPDDFLTHQFHREPALIVAKLLAQAAAIQRNLSQVLDPLGLLAPHFVALVRTHTEIWGAE